MMTEKS